MTDEVLRRLERTRDRGATDEAAYLTAALRAGAIPRERLEFAARLGDEGAARALGIEPGPRPALSADTLPPVIAGKQIEPYAIVPLALARALRKQWDKFTKSARVGDLIAATDAWLAHPCEDHRLEASRCGRPVSASGWNDELSLVRSGGKRQLLKWNKKAHDQFPPGPKFAERFATQAAQTAGATSVSRAEALLHETLSAFDHNTHIGMDFFNHAPVPVEDLADSVANALAGWALGRTATHVATSKPRRPPPPPPKPVPSRESMPKYMQEIIARNEKDKKEQRRKAAKKRSASRKGS